MQRSDGGGVFDVLDRMNGQALCGCSSVSACQVCSIDHFSLFCLTVQKFFNVLVLRAIALFALCTVYAFYHFQLWFVCFFLYRPWACPNGREEPCLEVGRVQLLSMAVP